MNPKSQAFLIRTLLFLIGSLPKSWVAGLSRILGRLAPRVLKRDSRLIALNVARVYGLAAHSSYQKKFQEQVFQSQLSIGLETLKSMLWPKRFPVRLDGLEALRELLAPLSGRGLIVITAHLGSWEMVAQVIALATGRRFYALAKPSKAPAFTEVLGAMRSGHNTEVLWTDRKNLLREMMRILKDGENLGFVMDQKPEGRVGPIVDFLGSPTEFVSGPAKLALRHQVPVLAVFCMRAGPWHYRIHTQMVDSAQDEQGLTQSMAAAVETCIRLYPEQWLWNYKRWRLPSQTQSLPSAASNP